MDSFSLPPVQTDSSAWLGPEMATQPETWQWSWTQEEISELEQAAAPLVKQEVEIGQIQQKDLK